MESATVDPLWIIPFFLLLAMIAAMPFINGEWWGRRYKVVAVALGLITAGYYIIGLGNAGRVWASLHEYVSFIALIGSLYVTAGGVHITIKGRSTPAGNLLFLAVGGIIANLLGTTGASMLLIRPYLRNNRYRLSAYHVVFFIFIVSNVGGALTPIGDPPLFLGYLKGVPFFWITERMILPWALVLLLLLGIFYLIDRQSYRKMPEELRSTVETENGATRVMGLHNLIFLAVIIGAVFIEHPMALREVLMLGAAAASYYTTKGEIHERNQFTFHPIEEVAYLFIGIFLTMLPALDWLSANAAHLGIESPGGFYWITGALSSVLDNAPTYLNFLSAALGLAGLEVGNPQHVLQYLQTGGLHVAAISAAAVFFGAMTYIGNGPNFMVKAIAEQAGVRMPGFFGYIVTFSLPVLLPVYLLVWIIFFS